MYQIQSGVCVCVRERERERERERDRERITMLSTVKPTCVKRPLKIDKTKNLMTNGSFMKVERILQNALLGAFCNTFDLH